MSEAERVKVLVVEDESLVAVPMEDALSEAGFDPTILPTGERALALLEQDPTGFRALVTDVRLTGEVDGWDMARRARELQPDVPVVYISGDSAGEWASKGVPNSVMLEKPFAWAQLVTALSTLLNSPTAG